MFIPKRFIAVGLTLLIAACQTTGLTFKSAKSKLSSEDQIVSGLLAKPKGDGPFPAVILLHTCGGVMPHVSRDWPNFLTGEGYAVLTIDSYTRRGIRTCDEANFMTRLVWLINDAYGGMDYLAGLPDIDGSRVAVMGFSQGSRAINNVLIPFRPSGDFQSSKGLEFKAAISVYGDCSGINAKSEIPFPLMQIIGDKDSLVFSCQRLKGIEGIDLNIIPGAYHAFDSRKSSGKKDVGGKLMIYSSGAVKKAHELAKTFLAKHL